MTLRDPFNPATGEFADNIRLTRGNDDSELRESLKKFGWVKEFPALMDEHGVVLVGHRRLKLAKQLEIKPIVTKLTLGSGDAADAERFKIALASNIGFAPMTKEDRKRIAEYLYGKRDWTIARIAEALNVGKSAIQRDLAHLPAAGKCQEDRSLDSLGRKKSSGRPKSSKGANGSKKPRPKKTDAHEAKIIAMSDQGKTAPEIAAEVDINPRVVLRAIQDERIRREAQAAIDPTTLSLSAQERLNAAIRQEQRRLELEYAERLRREIVQRINEMQLPYWRDLLKKLYDSIERMRRRGIMTKAEFNKIWTCLHTDSRRSTTAEKLNEAFSLFERLKLVLLSKEDEPTPFPDTMPRTYEEWTARKREVSERRRAQRAAQSVVRRR